MLKKTTKTTGLAYTGESSFTENGFKDMVDSKLNMSQERGLATKKAVAALGRVLPIGQQR